MWGGATYFEVDRSRAELKVSDHLFPETRHGGRARRTLTVVPEPHVRVPVHARANAVVQPDFVPMAIVGRTDRRRRHRPLWSDAAAAAVVHTGRCRIIRFILEVR